MEINVIDIAKSLFWDLMVKKAIADAIAFLAIPASGPIAFIVTKIIVKFTDKLYFYFSQEIKIGALKLENELHQKAFERAQIKLKLIALEKGIESDEFKNQRKIEVEKLADLIRFIDKPTSVQIGTN
jgi:hypothetical protein